MQRELEELRAEVHHLKEKLRTHACCLNSCNPAAVAYPDQVSHRIILDAPEDLTISYHLRFPVNQQH